MGSGSSTSRSKPVRPARAEPAWLELKSHGDAFGLRHNAARCTATTPEFDKPYTPEPPLDPIGRLTYVTERVAKDDRAEVGYTYTWPEPTTGPLARLAPIWHCTQYTATVAYRDSKARDRTSTALPGGTAFKLAHARGQGAKVEWKHLIDRTRNARVNSRGKSVWETWRDKQPKKDRDLKGFRTAEETMNSMVGHIQELVRGAGRQAAGGETTNTV